MALGAVSVRQHRAAHRLLMPLGGLYAVNLAALCLRSERLMRSVDTTALANRVDRAVEDARIMAGESPPWRNADESATHVRPAGRRPQRG